MKRLNIALHGVRGEQRPAVARTFDERNVRHHRISSQGLHRENQRPLDQAVNDKAMEIRINGRNSGVHNGEMQTIGSNRPFHELMRSTSLGNTWQVIGVRQGTNNLAGELRWRLIGRNRIAIDEAPWGIRKRRSQSLSGDAGSTDRGSGKYKAAVQKSPAMK